MAKDWLQGLIEKGLISQDQLDEAQGISRRKGGSPGEILVKLGYIEANDLQSAQSSSFGDSMINLEEENVPRDIIGLVNESFAREKVLLPLRLEDGKVVVAFHDPMALDVLDALRFLLNKEVKVVVASKEQIKAAIDRHYGQGGVEQSVDTIISEITETQIEYTETEASSASEDEENAPIVKLVTMIINEAVKMRASDIHIEPFEDRVRIRYRIDGSLIERDKVPRRLLGPLISRIKVVASMDIAERRRPQDGRIKTRANGKELDLRVSVLPTNHGQAMVLRILDRDNIKVGIRNLGFSEDNYRKFQNIIRRPNGIFLVTGPTGSGKTTTLYSALGELNRPDRKIITAEDPVEYYLPGINQVEVKHNIGLDFQRIVRAMLRQAPNVILVGEIRDVETAEMAIQASLTGHLVFSTLHTNDAPSSITRLIDMGVQPFLVASSVMAVMAQRLVRVICPKCKEEYKPDRSEIEYFEITEDELADGVFARGRGCNYCQHTGYRGRRAVFELMTMNSAIREMTFKSEPAQAIRRQARLFGMKTLVDDAKEKALKGLTTLAEVNKLMKAYD